MSRVLRKASNVSLSVNLEANLIINKIWVSSLEFVLQDVIHNTEVKARLYSDLGVTYNWINKSPLTKEAHHILPLCEFSAYNVFASLSVKEGVDI